MLENKDGKLWNIFHEEFEEFRETIRAAKALPESKEYLKDLQRKIKAHRGEELPLFPSYSLAKQEIGKILKEWEGPALALVDCVLEELKEIVDEFTHKSGGRFKNITHRLHFELEQILEEKENEIKKRIQQMITSMVDVPYTQNDYYDENVMKILLGYFETESKETFTRDLKRMTTMDLNKIIALYERTQGIRARVFKEQKFEAIQLKAAIEAYVKVCYKRFMDEVPQLLLFNLKLELSEQIPERLRTIAYSEQKDIEELFHENPQIQRERKQLNSDLICLKKCMKILNENIHDFPGEWANWTKKTKSMRKNRKQKKAAAQNQCVQTKAKMPGYTRMTMQTIEKHKRYKVTEDPDEFKKKFTAYGCEQYFGRMVTSLNIDYDDNSVLCRLNDQRTKWFQVGYLYKAENTEQFESESEQEFSSSDDDSSDSDE